MSITKMKMTLCSKQILCLLWKLTNEPFETVFCFHTPPAPHERVWVVFLIVTDADIIWGLIIVRLFLCSTSPNYVLLQLPLPLARWVVLWKVQHILTSARNQRSLGTLGSCTFGLSGIRPDKRDIKLMFREGTIMRGSLLLPCQEDSNFL